MFLLAALGETLYHSQIEYKYELINGFWGVFFFFCSFTNMEFWVDLVNVNNNWIWGNGDPFVNDSIMRLALPPANDSCVLWSPLEPFLKNVSCSSIADIMCAVPNASGI